MIDPRKPAVPIAVEDDPEYVIVNRRGEVRRAILTIYSSEDTDRIRLGYCCLRCGESQNGHGDGKPFPKECWLCKYPMAEKQGHDFAYGFSGEIKTGPSTSVEEELAIAQEIEDRKVREESPYTGPIFIPQGF